MANDMSNPQVGEVAMTRRLSAPRELVWKAWTDPAMLALWWGPRGFTNPEVRIEPKVGGELWIVMRGPDGADYPMRGRFQEVDPPNRLVFANQAVDGDGRVVLDGVTTVVFETAGEGTEITVTSHMTAMVPEAAAYLAGMTEGWSQTLDKLVEQFA